MKHNKLTYLLCILLEANMLFDVIIHHHSRSMFVFVQKTNLLYTS